MKTFSFSIACQKSWLKTCSLFWYKYFDRTLTGLQDHERRMSEWEEPQVDEKEKNWGEVRFSSFIFLMSWNIDSIFEWQQQEKCFHKIKESLISTHLLSSGQERRRGVTSFLGDKTSISVRQEFRGLKEKNRDNFNNLRVTVSSKEKWVRTWNFMRNFRDYDLCDTVLSETGDKKCKGYKEKEAWRMSYTFFSLHV